MEGSIIKFLEILIRDPLIKKDFLDCLNQYVLYGNQGRNRSKPHQCFGALINSSTDKVIAWNVVEDKESQVFSSMKNIYLDKRIIGHIQDGDINKINILKKWKKPIRVYFDPNHVKSKFNRILENFNKKGKGCLSSIKKNLSDF